LAKEQERAARKAREAQIEAAVDRLESQRPVLEEQRAQAAQEAYIRQQQALMNLPQQMSAAGIANSGLAESSLVGLDTSYGNQVNEITRAYQNALNDLNTNIAQVRANGDTSLADLEADYLKQVQNISLQQAQAAENERLLQQEYAAKLAAAGASYKPKLSLAQAQSLLDGGVDSDEARQAYQYYTGVAYSPKLSSEAQKFYDAMENRLQTNPANAYFAQDQILNEVAYAIQSQVDAGRITEQDARLLAQKYGIDIM
jgi:hypothetical protein